MAFDQMKMINELRKAQKDLKKQKVVVTAGDNDEVEVTVNGELKVEDIKINPEFVDLNNIEDLEHALQIAIRDGLAKAQEIAAEKMKPLMGGLGNLGL